MERKQEKVRESMRKQEKAGESTEKKMRNNGKGLQLLPYMNVLCTYVQMFLCVRRAFSLYVHFCMYLQTRQTDTQYNRKHDRESLYKLNTNLSGLLLSLFFPRSISFTVPFTFLHIEHLLSTHSSCPFPTYFSVFSLLV